MRILLTGASGFVGSAVVDKLAECGSHEIVAVDLVQPPRDCRNGVHWITGDIGDDATIEALFDGRPFDALIHLATVPGGAAEENRRASNHVNIDASLAILEGLTSSATVPPRVIFASSIAVFGELDDAVIDDNTPVSPRLIYGAQKAMIETWISALSRRNEIRGLSLRLPGIVARPKAPSGMKSAFMSNLFHAAIERQSFVSPVSSQATLWLMSLEQVVDNMMLALEVDNVPIYEMTLPIIRVAMGDLVNAVIEATGVDPDFVRYEPDQLLEAGFGRMPEQNFKQANALGFQDDGDLRQLVTRAFSTLNQAEAA